MTQGAQKFTEEDLKKAREIAHSIPPCDFGSTEAIKVFAQALRDERKGLEARLAEAVCALKEYAVHQADCVCLDDYVPHSADCAYCDCGLNAFLSSTTNSEAQERESLDSQIDRLAKFIMEEVDGEPSQSEGAVDCAIRIIRKLQERQRAKDEVIKDLADWSRRWPKETTYSMGRREKIEQELYEIEERAKALDSLPSEARGGCEHDNRHGFYKSGENSLTGNSYDFVPHSSGRPCPFCDKKTGGV